jgi:hypothetical protein
VGLHAGVAAARNAEGGVEIFVVRGDGMALQEGNSQLEAMSSRLSPDHFSIPRRPEPLPTLGPLTSSG